MKKQITKEIPKRKYQKRPKPKRCKPGHVVPVLDKDNKPLMPTTRKRAFSWIKTRKATPFYKKGIFCVRLNIEPSNRIFQQITVGIDPGSKEEGITIKSPTKTYFNIQAQAITHVKQSEERSTNARKNRRYRNTPCRKCRRNRKGRKGLPPSTKARWDWKLRIVKFFGKLLPITHYVVEDVCAVSKEDSKRWNASFSPVQMGKNYFYQELEKLGLVTLRQGYETKELRDELGLKKSKNKLEVIFSAHCVDSWVLANSLTNIQTKPDNTKIHRMESLRFNRRQLHMFAPSKEGKRRRQGGTRSMGFTRGSLVKHVTYGVCYVGGTNNGRISLHDVVDGERITVNASVEDCKFLTYNSWLIN